MHPHSWKWAPTRHQEGSREAQLHARTCISPESSKLQCKVLTTPVRVLDRDVMPAPGMEMSTCPHAHASVKISWASTNCRFLAAFLKLTHPMGSAVKIKFFRLLRNYLKCKCEYNCDGHIFISKLSFQPWLAPQISKPKPYTSPA